MASTEASPASEAPRAAASTAERRLRERARELHIATPRLLDRLTLAEPAHARQAYLEQQLKAAVRLTTAMTASVDPLEIARTVVDELHFTFGVYLAVVQRLDPDGKLRVVASAGPLAGVLEQFLLLEQSVADGVNGRVARTGTPALVSDTRLDPDYVVRDRATDPRSELAVPVLVEGHVWGVLNLEEVRPNTFDQDDVTLMQLIAAALGGTLHRCRLYDELDSAFATTLTALCEAADANDSYTAAHASDVSELALATARELSLGPVEQRCVRFAALTHDLGKIGVSTEILNKPGPLDEREWEVMRQHTIIGAELLRKIPFFADVHPLVRSHHERWDGSGYPDRLSGSQIPIGARIVAVCDAYNAMVTDRPYRAAMTQAKALAELQRCSGTQFDESVVAALLRNVA
jgi:putative nucleotidyltransferase with HDIG domain